MIDSNGQTITTDLKSKAEIAEEIVSKLISVMQEKEK